MIILRLKKIYRWIQAMSLDVVLGSGLLSLAIARYYEVILPYPVVAGLMVAVWAIYTFDHLSDAKKVRREASAHRHRYHQKHYKKIRSGLILAVLAGSGLLFLLPSVVVKWGIICAALVGFYFLLLKIHPFWFKELLVALCYTIGVFLGPLALSQVALNPFQLILIPQIFLLALANLVIFSCFDYQTDRQDGHYSLALHFGLERTRKIALALVGAGLALSVPMFFFAGILITMEVQLLMVAMNLLLLMLLLKEKRFREHDLYRIVGDSIFFIPALLLLYAR